MKQKNCFIATAIKYTNGVIPAPQNARDKPRPVEDSDLSENPDILLEAGLVTAKLKAGTDQVRHDRTCLFICRVISIILFVLILLPAMVWAQGRSADTPQNPVRIVSLAPSTTEIIFALGESDRLKGVSRFSDYPAEATQMPCVGSYINLDLEKIVSLKPDLCIGVKDGNEKTQIQHLETFGIPVYLVNPKDLKSIVRTLIEVGQLLGVPEKANALAEKMLLRIDQVINIVSKTRDRPKVFFQIGISPIVSVGSHTFTHELIQLAGGENLGKGSVAYPRLSLEKVLAMAPEVIIISSMARGEVFQKVEKEWREWQDLPAVKNNRIYLVDSNLLDRPTPRMIDSLEMLVKIIHPELFREPKT